MVTSAAGERGRETGNPGLGGGWRLVMRGADVEEEEKRRAQTDGSLPSNAHARCQAHLTRGLHFRETRFPCY